MTKTLILLRGLPGSGKTTMAKMLQSNFPMCHHFEADQYHTKLDGTYEWIPANVHKAHTVCQENTENSMEQAIPYIIVSNTFTRNRELRPYIKLAQKFGYKFHVLTVESGMTNEALSNRNIHSVPLNSIHIMDERWERFLL